MSRIEWKDWSGVPIESSRREEWATEAVKEMQASDAERAAEDEDWFQQRAISSGDSLVLATLNFDGSVTIRDCLVRRRAEVPKEAQ